MRLRAEGFESLFLDFDPEDGIATGRNWERELYKQLRIADALIFLGSPDAATSKWCFAELAVARSAGKPVFPILVGGNGRHPLLEDTQWVDLTTESETGWQRLWSALERSGFDPRDAFNWDVRRPPYPGLAPFEPEDAAMFFGRSDKIDELFAHLHPTLKRADGRFIAVIGASGTGKSSLVRAGLIPRLQRLRERWIVIPPFAPGSRPTAALARTLGAALREVGRDVSRRDLEDALQRDPVALAELVQDLCYAKGATDASVLLVVDQAEELSTLADEGGRAKFVDIIAGALDASAPLFVVATFRSEFLTTSLADSALAALIDESIVLGPLDRSRIPDVIEGPANRAGLEVERGLVGRMVEDTRGGDALPLLAYTLQQLYSLAGEEGRITARDYEAIGGVLGALKRSADRVAQELARQGKGDRVIPTLLELVRLDGGTEPARARVLRSELDEVENEIVQAFVEARLLKSEGSREDATVEVAHEALLRAWTPLSEAIDASRDDLRIRSELERVALEWDRNAHEDDMLYRGARLQRTSDWRERAQPALSPAERGFLDASLAAEVTELEHEQRRTRRLRMLALALVVLLALAGAAALYAVEQSRRAEQQTRTTVSGRLAEQAVDNLDTRLHVAVLLALEAYRSDDTPEARSAALAAVGRSDGILGFVHLDDDAFTVRFSPGGRFAAAIGEFGPITILDVAARRSVAEVTAAGSDFDFFALSPDGSRFAIALEDGPLELWDVARERRVWSKPSAVFDISFTSDGRRLVAARADGAIVVWSADGELVESFELERGRVSNMTLSIDGTKVALQRADGVTVWDIPGRRALGGTPLLPAYDRIQLSPDGRTLVSYKSTAVTVWDVPARRRLSRLKLTASEVALDPAGKMLAVATYDGMVYLYDAATKEQVREPLEAGGDTVWSVAFSPDGKTLAWSSKEATVAFWAPSGEGAVSEPLRGHRGEGTSVAFTPRGDVLASASYDGTVRFWNVAEKRPMPPVLKPGGKVVAVAFSGDGQLLAVGGADGLLRLWNVETRAWYGRRLVGHKDNVESLRFFDGKPVLASAGADSTVRLWRVDRQEPIGKPLPTASFPEEIAVARDGTLAWGDGPSIRLWNVKSNAPAGKLLSSQKDVSSVAFSPDGKILASGAEDGTVTLWDRATGRPLGEPLRGHREDVLGLAFAPDGRTLASASIEGTVRLWDVATRRPLGEPLTGHDDDATSVAFSPDGKLLASAGSNPPVILWSSLLWSDDSEVLTRHLCPIVGRNLTRAEWAEFMPGKTYRKTCDEWPLGPERAAGADGRASEQKRTRDKG